MEQKDFFPRKLLDIVRQRGQICLWLIDGNILLEELEIGLGMY